MPVTRFSFGTTRNGFSVTAYCLSNSAGMSVTVLDYGATIQSLSVPTRFGGTLDVILGYDTIAEYEDNSGYLGATIGRMANRIGGASFSLGGRIYRLAPNDGDNHLHGGEVGFDKRMWRIVPEDNALLCTRLSPDGEEGYPGNLQVQVSFRLYEENRLLICYEADTDQDTVVNLTNHSYFNLSGEGTILDHELQIFAGRFTENDSGCLPTGRLLDVENTPFDFRVAKRIGTDINQSDLQLKYGNGYDHNFILSGSKAAVLYSPVSGIELTVETDMPGMQVYSANALTPRAGKNGARMAPRGAICLETQLFPNAMACYGFPSPVLRAGQHLRSETNFRFRVLSE